jgi:hypothetical protein
MKTKGQKKAERPRKKGFLERQGYRNIKRRLLISALILVLALIIFTGYFLIFQTRTCESDKCFDQALAKCKKYSLIREDAQAAWLYKVLGKEGDNCKMEVTLLHVKSGQIESEELEGKSMVCTVPRGSKDNPEEDISRCTGPLKEGIQEIIIQRMHNYLLENIQEISREFSQV